jgi:diaminohydroxyphosphoribosylaminopyrimidine deaminase / 5-amino-6-(5-phosphoribosylamino)uracil reductase
MRVRTNRRVWVEEAPLTEETAWSLLRALAREARSGHAVGKPSGVRLDGDGRYQEVDLGMGLLDVYPGAEPLFRTASTLAPAVEHMLDLYLPLCLGPESNDLVVGHLGQSLDGQIATSTGASCFITGPQDLTHTHRLRALFDAVLVGRATVDYDDPRLTTRLVPGENATRVVVDPSLRGSGERKVFRDRAAPTLLYCLQRSCNGARDYGLTEVVGLAVPGPVLPPAAIVEDLRRRGLRRVFVEGGGVTVSHFLQAGLLRRLHVTVSPLFLGQGKPGLVLAKIDGLDQALRPRVRRFDMGEDVLFDCEL